MSGFTRAILPAVALGIGTWVGLGRPDAQTAVAAGERLMARASATGTPAGPAVPPLDRKPSTVDPTALPDPRPPWPRLNPNDSTERAWLLSEGPAHAANDGRRLVTFTFDDGPSPETAPTLLRILANHKIRATFFFIGQYLTGDDRRAAESRLWASRIAAAGHLVGNHTLDHRVLTGLSHAAALAQIDDSAGAIERVTGQRPWLFRPPYGAMDDWLEGAARDRRLDLLLWNIDVQDMKRTDPDEILKLLEDHLEYAQGGIVLLHDVHWASIKAFNRLLRWLEASKWDPSHPAQRGWDIVDLGEYMRATAASPQPYRTRDELEHARHEASVDRRRADL
jgi:peptidoglycan/xylan/chitin deacetylase (PgdA/CDA1 family)